MSISSLARAIALAFIIPGNPILLSLIVDTDVDLTSYNFFVQEERAFAHPSSQPIRSYHTASSCGGGR